MCSPFRILAWLLILCPSGALLAADAKSKKPPVPSALDRYIQEALAHPSSPPAQPSPGSLWSPASRLVELGSDVRAGQVDDLVTIMVEESASAVAQGASKTQRTSALSSSVTSLAGKKSLNGALANLAGANTASSLDGQGTTTRSATLNTTLSARVTHVLPNGYLVVEGNKEVVVNSEHQMVTVRGVVRPADLATDNSIRSNQIAQMEIKIDGKGVVNDAVRRPFILWRVIMGLLPF
jgi:flagellar L-ring protein precursor FlgH